MGRTPLFEWHNNAKARMVEFAGWEMPLQYSGIREEHWAVRRKAGLFDLCHMGQVEVLGLDAERTMNRLMANDPTRIPSSKGQYSFVMNDRGGIVDDVIVYKQEHGFLLVVNASNRQQVLAHIEAYAVGETEVRDQSSQTGLLAIQGPNALELVSSYMDRRIAELPPFGWMWTMWDGVSVLVSRTGYTGEDGVELFFDWQQTERLWVSLLQAGEAFGLLPCGLGARDTLRLEARLPLHGSDITESTTPIEAGLKRFVVLEDREFLGSSLLREQLEKGVDQRLIGFYLEGKQVPRSGYPLYAGGIQVGEVTSGTLSPVLNCGIGMAYAASDAAAQPGLQLEIRGKRHAVNVHKGSFLKLESKTKSKTKSKGK